MIVCSASIPLRFLKPTRITHHAARSTRGSCPVHPINNSLQHLQHLRRLGSAGFAPRLFRLRVLY